MILILDVKNYGGVYIFWHLVKQLTFLMGTLGITFGCNCDGCWRGLLMVVDGLRGFWKVLMVTGDLNAAFDIEWQCAKVATKLSKNGISLCHSFGHSWIVSYLLALLAFQYGENRIKKEKNQATAGFIPRLCIPSKQRLWNSWSEAPSALSLPFW